MQTQIIRTMEFPLDAGYFFPSQGTFLEGTVQKEFRQFLHINFMVLLSSNFMTDGDHKSKYKVV